MRVFVLYRNITSQNIIKMLHLLFYSGFWVASARVTPFMNPKGIDRYCICNIGNSSEVLCTLHFSSTCNMGIKSGIVHSIWFKCAITHAVMK